MQRCLVLICIAISLVSHASALEFTHTPTPKLAEVQVTRVFAYASPGGSCDLAESQIVTVAKQTMSAAGIASVDGFDPIGTDLPTLEIDVAALELMRKCYLTLKIALRIATATATVRGAEYEMVWADVDNYVCLPNEVVNQTSELLRSRLQTMIADIERSRKKFPYL